MVMALAIQGAMAQEVLDSLEIILSLNNMEITGKAHDGNEALEKMQQNHFNLVLSDIWMPNMDGFGLVEKIRQDESLKDIPVFAITADASSVKDARADLFTAIYC